MFLCLHCLSAFSAFTTRLDSRSTEEFTKTSPLPFGVLRVHHTFLLTVSEPGAQDCGRSRAGSAAGTVTASVAQFRSDLMSRRLKFRTFRTRSPPPPFSLSETPDLGFM